MEGMELVIFQIISAVGTAKSMYIEAVDQAKVGHFAEAREIIAEGDKSFVEGHHVHTDLVQREAGGEKLEIGLLMMHAEDQLMSAETIKIMALEMIELYERLV